MEMPESPDENGQTPDPKEGDDQSPEASDHASPAEGGSWKKELARSPYGAAALIIMTLASAFWASLGFETLNQWQTFVIAIAMVVVLVLMVLVFYKSARVHSPPADQAPPPKPKPPSPDRQALHDRLFEIWGHQHRPDFEMPHDPNNERAAYNAVNAIERTAVLWKASSEEERECIVESIGKLTMDWMYFLDHHPITLSRGDLLRAEISYDSLLMVKEFRRHGFQ